MSRRMPGPVREKTPVSRPPGRTFGDHRPVRGSIGHRDPAGRRTIRTWPGGPL